MTEEEWRAGDSLAMIDWLLQQKPPGSRLDRFAAAYYGWEYTDLAPLLISTVSSQTEQLLYFMAAEDHDDRWGHPFKPAAALPLLCCFFGNPFNPVALDPAWLTPTVVALATQMYRSEQHTSA